MLVTSRTLPRRIYQSSEDTVPESMWKTLTFFKAAECDIWILHFNLAFERHKREAFDNLGSPPLRNGVVKTLYMELERCIGNVMGP